MGYGDPLPQSNREAELHALYLAKARDRMMNAVDRDKAEKAERRYSALHERESQRRMRIASQMEVARKINPRGGFWYVDDSAREHCPTCAARGGRNYTWDQLDRIDPTQNHAGCRCSILPALTHGEWAEEYNPLTEALIIQMVKRGKAWVPVARDSSSRFPQRFASTDGSGVSAPPVRGKKRVGPVKLDKKAKKVGQRYSPGNFIKGLSEAKKKELRKLGSYDLIQDMIGGRTTAPIKKALGGKALEEHVHPAHVPSQELVREVAEKVGLIPDRALLRVEMYEIREKNRDQVITDGEYLTRRKQIEKELAKPAVINPRADRMPKVEVAAPPLEAQTYAIPAKPKRKPVNARAPKKDKITQKIEAIYRNQGYSASQILSSMGGHEKMGYATREIAIGEINAVIDRIKKEDKGAKAAVEKVDRAAEKIRQTIASRDAGSDEAREKIVARAAAVRSMAFDDLATDAVNALHSELDYVASVKTGVSLLRQMITDYTKRMTQGKTDPGVYAGVTKNMKVAREWIDEFLKPLVKSHGSTAPGDLDEVQLLIYEEAVDRVLRLIVETELVIQTSKPGKA